MFYFFRELKPYRQQKYLRSFSLTYLSKVLVMMAVIVSLNYYPLAGWQMQGTASSFLFVSKYVLYLVPFAMAFVMQLLFFHDATHLRSGWLWLVILVAPAIFSFRINFNFYAFFIDAFISTKEQYYWYYILNRIMKVITLLLPVSLFWFIKDRKVETLYGFKTAFHWQPYCLLILLMLPAVAAASSDPGFLKTYPAAYHAIGSNQRGDLSLWILYELCYALDFLSIEYFFRGLLVIALIKVCGLHSIIPAACFYCCIHFGKPMPEAIGSFFGASLLGIISYHTRSIWPGLIVHIGVAASIELLCYQQHLT
jgi:hypothetical protein